MFVRPRPGRSSCVLELCDKLGGAVSIRWIRMIKAMIRCVRMMKACPSSLWEGGEDEKQSGAGDLCSDYPIADLRLLLRFTPTR
eukprot:572408-Rhodomonas_salina.1